MIKGYLSFLFLSASLLLHGCYCFRPSAHENVRFPFTTTDSPFCNWDGKGTFNMQVHAYYGSPNTDRVDIANAYAGTIQSIHTKGLAGIRAETYISPFHLSQYAIMGVGADYSRSVNNLRYAASGTTTDVHYVNNRIMTSVNLILLVQGYFIGYTTMQGGYNFTSSRYKTNDPSFLLKYSHHDPRFDYRVGYGLEYYFGPYFGAVAEGGYNGGAYARTGLCYWFR